MLLRKFCLTILPSVNIMLCVVFKLILINREVNIWMYRAYFGSIDSVHTVQKRKPPKTLQPCDFWAVWKTKNSGQKCV